ncbi:S24 family peptidase [Halomonas alkaliantarctica]|uniref:S24 family peptidase n=1 Tax=Halomonas alkaliantarctica TaxID=232346 RepID=A0ABY8LJ93_9GAMM|nr:S24 family peptidase [Halomonas alkaliantarctica]WGI23659.1 S24 family peptidase [Halomonas alkaliantarctica]
MEITDLRRENLKRILDARFNGKRAALADAIDREASYISRCLSDKAHRKKIGEEFARHIESRLNLPSRWLDQESPNTKDSQLSPAGGIENIDIAPTMAGMSPEIGWAQAGAWTEVCDIEINPEKYHPRPSNASPNTFVLRVVGESMLPEYTPGTLIFVDPEKVAENGKDVIAVMTETNEATFKRYIEEPGHGKMLKALNPNWHEPYVKINGNCRVIGVIVADMRIR